MRIVERQDDIVVICAGHRDILARKAAFAPGGQVVVALALEFIGFRFAVADHQRAAGLRQMQRGAVADGVGLAHAHPFVDVGVDQRTQVEQAGQRRRAAHHAGRNVIAGMPAPGQQRADQVPARGAAADMDARGVAAVFGDVAVHPGQRAPVLVHDAVQRDGGRQRIVHRHDHRARLRERGRHAAGFVLGQEAPVAAMDEHEYRRAGRAGRGAGGGEYIQHFVGVVAERHVQRAVQRAPRGGAVLGVFLEYRLDVGYCRASVVLDVQSGAVVVAVEGNHGGGFVV
ncbi:hypothetical protein D3C72_1333930 [compost metagenome]